MIWQMDKINEKPYYLSFEYGMDNKLGWFSRFVIFDNQNVFDDSILCKNFINKIEHINYDYEIINIDDLEQSSLSVFTFYVAKMGKRDFKSIPKICKEYTKELSLELETK